MRKIVLSSIAALAGISFAASAWAGEGCAGWGDHVASTPKPVVTADSSKTVPQTPITTDSKTGG